MSGFGRGSDVSIRRGSGRWYVGTRAGRRVTGRRALCGLSDGWWEAVNGRSRRRPRPTPAAAAPASPTGAASAGSGGISYGTTYVQALDRIYSSTRLHAPCIQALAQTRFRRALAMLLQMVSQVPTKS